MENVPKKRKFLSGKNDSSPDGFSMILRSSCQDYDCANSSVSSYSGSLASPMRVRALKTAKDVGHSHQHHHHHHHHHNHHQHSHHSNEILSHQHHQEQQTQQNTRVLNWVNAEQKQAHAFEIKGHTKFVQEKSFEEVNAFSDYSGDNEEITDEDIKTEYTYAKSVSYSSRVTPTRTCSSPNMSRTQIRRLNQGSSQASSDEVVDSKDFLKLSSNLTSDSRYMRSSTPNLIDNSHTVESRVTTARTDVQEDEEEFLKWSSPLRKEWSSFNSQSSPEGVAGRMVSLVSRLCSSLFHSLYAFTYLMMWSDVWLLSRCQSLRSSRSWKIPLLLACCLLLPLLLWLLSTSFHSNASSPLHNHHPSAFISSKEDLRVISPVPAVPEGDLPVPTIPGKIDADAFSQWEKLMEQKWQQETVKICKQEAEKILAQQEQKQAGWQLNLLQDISAKIAAFQANLSSLSEEQTLAGKEKDSLNVLAAHYQELSKEMSEVKLKLEAQRSSFGTKFEKIEKQQQALEDLLLGIKNCCKKQESWAAGVSQADLDLQLAYLVQEIRTNLSHLAYLNSAAASNNPSEIVSGHVHTQRFNSSVQCPTVNEVQQMVKTALYVYDADKTGLVDYALESAGGSVVSTRCTETYPLGTAQFSLFGVPFWYSANTPRTVIQPQVHPGECWAMRGTQGYLVIMLSASIRPTAFSLEHIPKELSPTGTINSAPKEFSVWGLTSEKDSDGHLLGIFTYLENGDPLQKFAVTESMPVAFSVVELRIHSNHGNPEYTCLYRFRVHGLRQ